MPTVEEELTQLLRDRAEQVPGDPQLARKATARSARMAVRSRALVAVSAAAAVAVAVGVTVVFGGPDRNSSAPVVANTAPADFLVPAPSLSITFPLTPTYLPPGSGTEPQLELNADQMVAVYQGSGPRSTKVIVVVQKGEPAPEPEADRSPITVEGKQGILSRHPSGQSVSWLRRPGQWVSVSGFVFVPDAYDGEDLDTAELVRIAEGLVDRPQTQRAAFNIELAPAGHELIENGSGQVVFAPAGEGLDAARLVRISTSRGSEAVARDEVTGEKSVIVRGRAGILGTQKDTGHLSISVPLAPDDSRLDIVVPSDGPWTEEVLLRFAEGIDYVRRPMWP